MKITRRIWRVYLMRQMPARLQSQNQGTVAVLDRP